MRQLLPWQTADLISCLACSWSCTKGAWLVSDLIAGSPTAGSWEGSELPWQGTWSSLFCREARLEVVLWAEDSVLSTPCTVCG